MPTLTAATAEFIAAPTSAVADLLDVCVTITLSTPEAAIGLDGADIVMLLDDADVALGVDAPEATMVMLAPEVSFLFKDCADA